MDSLYPILKWFVLVEIAFWATMTYSAHKRRKTLKEQAEFVKEYTRRTGEIFAENLLQAAHLHGYTEIESVAVSFNDKWEPTLKFGTAWHIMSHPYSSSISYEDWLKLCERWRMTHRPPEEMQEIEE